MVADDLGHERKAKAGPRRLGGDERIEEMRHEIGRNAGAVVLHGDLEWQAYPGLAAWNREAHAGPEGGGEGDLAVGTLVVDRFGGVLDEVEEHLDELVAASRNRRQRWIVVLDDLDLAGEAVGGDLLHVIEHIVNVDRLPRQRPFVAEDLHAIHELADAFDFGADQLGECAVGLSPLVFDQLGSAPDAGKRVLDFMGEHCGESRDRSGGAAMDELSLDHLRHAPLLQHDEYASGRLGHGAAVEIDKLWRIETVGAEVDPVFVDVGFVPLHLLDKGDERAAEGDDVGELALAENRGAHLEEIHGRGVGVVDMQTLADDKHRVRQCIQQRFARHRRPLNWTPRARLSGRGAQAMYPRNPGDQWPCTKNKQQRPRIFYCAEYGGFAPVAMRLLPHSTKLFRLLMGTSE